MAGLPLTIANELKPPGTPLVSMVTGAAQVVPLTSVARTYRNAKEGDPRLKHMAGLPLTTAIEISVPALVMSVKLIGVPQAVPFASVARTYFNLPTLPSL